MDDKKTQEQYVEIIEKAVKAAQETGDIPELFTYKHNEKSWVLTLPHSVMAQKRLIAAQDKYLISGDFAAEEAFFVLIF